MKKYISFAFAAVLSLVFTACNKKADVAAIEPKLPALQLSSFGYQQTGPFTTGTTLSINFGATATNTPIGAFKVEIISGTSVTPTSTVLKTVNFPASIAWKGNDDTSTTTPTVVTNHTITYVSEETSYPNTVVYGGTINLKLSALGLSAASTYSVRATAYSADGTKTSQIIQTSFFKTI